MPTEIEPHVIEASRVLTNLRLNLVFACSVLAEEIKKITFKESPCTYQTYRALGGMMQEGADSITAMCKAADIPMQDQPESFKDFGLSDIPALFEKAEKIVDDVMMIPFKLDDLPPGNPGEPEFERLLKPKIETNKKYSECMHKLAVLANALDSKTYCIGITEDERRKEWQAARKAALENVLVDIDRQIKETEEFLAALNKSRTAIVERLATNEQMTFDQEIDPTKTPELGD
jgi:hypothetical protein